MTVEVRHHAPGEDVAVFMRAGRVVFEGDPAWIPPLDFELRERLTPGKNPIFEHMDVMLFTAWKDGRLVGRCSAQVDHQHQKKHADDIGFFGYFDTIDDEEVSSALLDAAAHWLRQRGMKRMRGPISLSMHEEIGLLIDGFEHPPMVMTPHSRPYQQRLAEAYGLEKERDWYAWWYEAGDIPKRALKAWEQVHALPEVTVRTLRKRELDDEIRLVLDIFNDAWSDNWGAVPMTAAEVNKAASDLKLVLTEDLAIMVEIDGEPAGMCVTFPNLNEAIRDLNGKLLPFGWAKLLWRVKVKHPDTARLFLLGVRKKYRGIKRYGGLPLALCVEIIKRGTAAGYWHGELSQTLEDNTPVNIMIKLMGGKVYKTYRIYEKALDGA